METISSEKIMSTLREELAQINATVDRQEASVVTEVADGIARISGLKSAMAGELLKLTSSATGLDVYGLVQNLDQDDVGAVLFGDAEEIKEGDECRTTGRVMDIPVGHAMLGRVVNPLGQPIGTLTANIVGTKGGIALLAINFFAQFGCGVAFVRPAQPNHALGARLSLRSSSRRRASSSRTAATRRCRSRTG